MQNAISGGDGIPWKSSLRGRVHAMQSAMASAEMLERAAEEVVRAQRETANRVEHARGRRLSRWLQVVIALAALATAAAPYVVAYVH